MKILDWNLNNVNRENPFVFALNNFKADFYMCQECYHPRAYLDDEEYDEIRGKYIWRPTRNGWGNLIFSPTYPIEQFPLGHSFKGRLLVAKSGELTLANIHVPVVHGYSRFTLRKIFDLLKPHIKSNSIIAGDLNFGKYFDHGNNHQCENILNEIMVENKIVSCYHLFNKNERQTFRPTRNPGAECMIDYTFVSRDLENKVLNCQVISSDVITKYSDHNPILTEMKL